MFRSKYSNKAEQCLEDMQLNKDEVKKVNTILQAYRKGYVESYYDGIKSKIVDNIMFSPKYKSLSQEAKEKVADERIESYFKKHNLVK